MLRTFDVIFRVKESAEDSLRGKMPQFMQVMVYMMIQQLLYGPGAALQRLSGRPKPSTEVNHVCYYVDHLTCSSKAT